MIKNYSCRVIALDIAPALAAIRTLDLEVIRNGQGPAEQRRYLDLQSTDAQGQVVRGLVLPRNADVHLPGALDVHAEISLGDSNWRVVPQWQPYGALPHNIRTSTGTKPSSHAAYRNAVGGNRVIETLLDAFAYFLRCDHSLAKRDPGTGKLAHFPLANDMAVLGDYERCHPDQPNREAMATRALQFAQNNPPTGTGREIQYSLTSDRSALYGGLTGCDHWRSFTEPGEQIVRDIRAGYPYSVVHADGARHTVTVETDGQLYANGQRLDLCPLPPGSSKRGPREANVEGSLLYLDDRQGQEGMRRLHAELND